MRGKSRTGTVCPRSHRGASMRPAHYAREVRGRTAQPAQPHAASMRPAHYAREVLSIRLLPAGGCRRFNEARALCAGSRGYKQRDLRKPNASMRPAHYAREVDNILLQERVESLASMRPAHYAREVRLRNATEGAPMKRFNEARALCAGSQLHLARTGPVLQASMRPAHYAREVNGAGAGVDQVHPASMRPAHYAREVSLRLR